MPSFIQAHFTASEQTDNYRYMTRTNQQVTY